MTTEDGDASNQLSAASVHPELLTFLDRMTKRGVIVRYEIRHIVMGAGETRVGVVDLDDHMGKTNEEIAGEIQELLNDDAAGFGGVQLYTILAYRQDEAKFFMRKHLRIRGSADDYDQELVSPSHPANPAGMLAQTQKHNEVLMRIGVEALLGLRRENRAEVERYMRRSEHLEDERDQVSQAMRQLTLEKSAQELALLKAQREDRQHQLTYNMLDLAMPAMLAKMLPSGTGAPPRDGDRLRDFLLGISPLQMQRIVPCLNPAQVLALDGLITAYKTGNVPSFGDVTVSKFLDSLEPPQVTAIEKILRVDQVNDLAEISKSYWEERARQGQDAHVNGQAPSEVS